MKVLKSENIDTLIKNESNITVNHKIYLISQFYIPNDNSRYKEICACLKKNLDLKMFHHIYLINERTYTKDEMGVSDDDMNNIKQIVFDKGQRMKYMHAFGLIKAMKLDGYVVIANSDIFFDNTLLNLEKTSLLREKSVYLLLRFEYTNQENLNDCPIFGPRLDSQDTWIFHSKYLPNDNQILKTNFLLGKAGCDNAIAYLFNEFGFKVFNEPYIIKTYHYHISKYRNYSGVDKIPPPYMVVTPVIRDNDLNVKKIKIL
jgi:hypothetical protein